MNARALILPPLRRTAADAQRFATIVHKGQVDKAGRPYIEHLERVAHGAGHEMVRYAGHEPGSLAADEARQIAWLHDTIEDKKATPAGLRVEGFSHAVVAGVEDLWKPAHLAYSAYIDWIARCSSLPTILVKLADVEDNSDPERLALLPEETRARLLRKYEPAKEVLRGAARRKGWQG